MADRPGEATPEAIENESGVSPRIEGLRSLELTPRRVEVRRLAAAMRDVIEHLVSTTATTEELSSAADDLEVLAGALRDLPRGQTYEGFAEAANAGEAIANRAGAAAGSAGRAPLGDDDPERYAFFDHSPFIGLANPLSPPMSLDYSADRVVGRVTFGSAYEGPPGCVHGGYIAGAFDELLGATQSLSGHPGMTARLTVNYRSPTPLHADLRMRGELTGVEGRKILTKGWLYAPEPDGSERLCAEADGLFVAIDFGRFATLKNEREQAERSRLEDR